MAHKKGAGSSDNGRDSMSKRLGVKMFGGQLAKAGNIIVRQRGTKFHAGDNVYMGRDHTLHAQIDGFIVFRKSRDDRRYVSIQPFDKVATDGGQTPPVKVKPLGSTTRPKVETVKATPAPKPVAKPVAAPKAKPVVEVALKVVAASVVEKVTIVEEVVVTPIAPAVENIIIADEPVIETVVENIVVVDEPVVETVVENIVVVDEPVVTTSSTTTTTRVIGSATSASTGSTTTTTRVVSSNPVSTESVVTRTIVAESVAETKEDSDWDTVSVDVVETKTVVSGSKIAAGVFGNIKADDLKIVEGIGPKIEQLLNEAGINTWVQLSETNPDRIREILDAAGPRFQMHNPSTWPAQAKFAGDGSWDELKEYQDMLIGGRDIQE